MEMKKCSMLIWKQCLPEKGEDIKAFKDILTGAVKAIIKDCVESCGTWVPGYDIVAFAQTQNQFVEMGEDEDLLGMIDYVNGWFISANALDIKLYKQINDEAVLVEFDAETDTEIAFVFYPRPWFLILLTSMLRFAKLAKTIAISGVETPFIITVDEDKIPAHIDADVFANEIAELCSRIIYVGGTAKCSLSEAAIGLFRGLSKTDMFIGSPFAAFLERVGGWVTIKEHKNGQVTASFVTVDEIKELAKIPEATEVLRIAWNEDEYLAFTPEEDEGTEKSVFIVDKIGLDVRQVGLKNKKENS